MRMLPVVVIFPLMARGATIEVTAGGSPSAPTLQMSDTSANVVAKIVSDSSAAFAFQTAASSGETPQTRMSISANGDVTIGNLTASGYIGLGTTLPAYQLHVHSGSSNDNTIFESSDTEVGVILKDLTGYAEIKSRDDFRFYVNSGSTRAMDIAQNGHVGIGTSPYISTPEAHLTINGNGPTATNNGMSSIGGKTGGLGFKWGGGTDEYLGLIALDGGTRTYNRGFAGFRGTNSAGAGLRDFVVGLPETTADQLPTEMLRLTSERKLRLFVSDSSNAPSSSNAGIEIASNIVIAHTTTAMANKIEFVNANGMVGRIYTSGSATVYATSSDYRLKENARPIADAAKRLMRLQPKTFNFISQPGTDVDGFLAHELQAEVRRRCQAR